MQKHSIQSFVISSTDSESSQSIVTFTALQSGSVNNWMHPFSKSLNVKFGTFFADIGLDIFKNCSVLDFHYVRYCLRISHEPRKLPWKHT